jgi:hypothetical protein
MGKELKSPCENNLPMKMQKRNESEKEISKERNEKMK